ncbi:MAG TPA: carbon-phosphorus lyase complex subunit PhnI, partial [Vicinamibacteria bacterium]
AHPAGHGAPHAAAAEPEPMPAPAATDSEPAHPETSGPEASRTPADRPFSLFSWIRRDSGER